MHNILDNTFVNANRIYSSRIVFFFVCLNEIGKTFLNIKLRQRMEMSFDEKMTKKKKRFFIEMLFPQIKSLLFLIFAVFSSFKNCQLQIFAQFYHPKMSLFDCAYFSTAVHCALRKFSYRSI